MKVEIGPFPKKFKGKRKIKVKIHPYDVYSLDHTLALIILPAMKLLAKNKQGTPMTMFSLRHSYLSSLRKLTAKEKKELKREDAGARKKWADILDDVIWSFEQIVNDKDNPAYEKGVLNSDKYKAYHERVDKGLKLFGEHYQSFWT